MAGGSALTCVPASAAGGRRSARPPTRWPEVKTFSGTAVTAAAVLFT
jgi:hypothetical protein